MNSRQRRKLAALQHNDAIRYEAWLKANAIYSRASAPRYHRAERGGTLSQYRIFATLSAACTLAMSGVKSK
jgi:hypothetical protein